MAKEETPQYPEGGSGPLPGNTRTRRRGSLPGGGGGVPESAVPLVTNLPTAAPAAEGDLAMTQKEALPEAKVWGLRVSEDHYKTATAMTKVLATRYGLDQRQAGELIIQFLVNNRFTLDQFFSQQVGPGLDLDFFTQKKPDV